MATFVLGKEGKLAYACRQVFTDTQVLDQTVCDVTHPEDIKRIAARSGDVVINATGYVKTEEAEAAYQAAFAVNAHGPLELARHTAVNDSVLVHISTDYVFSGEKQAYVEDDAVSPLNVYGLSKYAGEQAVRVYNPKHYIIRTSALFGPQEGVFGDNFVSRRYNELKAGKTIFMVNDQYTVPTYTFTVATVIQKLLALQAPYGTYHVVSNGGPVTWFEFAEAIKDIAKLPGVIQPSVTELSPGRMKRPLHSVLRDTKLSALSIELPMWQVSLQEYLTSYSTLPS